MGGTCSRPRAQQVPGWPGAQWETGLGCPGSGGAGHTAWASVCSGVLGAGRGQEDSVCLLRTEWMGAQSPDPVGLRGCLRAPGSAHRPAERMGVDRMGVQTPGLTAAQAWPLWGASDLPQGLSPRTPFLLSENLLLFPGKCLSGHKPPMWQSRRP